MLTTLVVSLTTLVIGYYLGRMYSIYRIISSKTFPATKIKQLRSKFKRLKVQYGQR